MDNKENNNRQKTKDEMKREKALNKSLTMMPKSTQNSLGVIAIQKEDGVFFLGGNIYLKIFSIKNSVLGPKKEIFVNSILELTMNRVRVSSFCKVKNQKLAAYTFLSVYFDCNNYAEAHREINEFDLLLQEKICRDLNIAITGCSIDTALMFMHMNCVGKMKQVKYDSMISQKQNLKDVIFADVKELSNGEFNIHDKYGVCFIGEYFRNEPIEINELISGIEGNIQFSIDMQRLSAEDWEILNFQLSQKYNHHIEGEQKDIINVTYLIAVLVDSQNEISRIKKHITEKYGEKGILVVPCSGREKKVFNSICSIGAVDFHSMRNANIDFVSSLII